jgi:hypothetical protein
MSARIPFRCTACNARLDAPIRLAGQYRPCPGCGQTIFIPVRVPDEEPPVLVSESTERSTHER